MLQVPLRQWLVICLKCRLCAVYATEWLNLVCRKSVPTLDRARDDLSVAPVEDVR